MDIISSQLVDEASEKVHLPRKAVLVLAQVDPLAFGIACGIILGLWLWLGTIMLVIRGGEHVGKNLSLLSQYFVGYQVTPFGSLLALIYGGVIGFFVGYVSARLRNLTMHAYLSYLRCRAERLAMSDMLDRLM